MQFGQSLQDRPNWSIQDGHWRLLFCSEVMEEAGPGGKPRSFSQQHSPAPPEDLIPDQRGHPIPSASSGIVPVGITCLDF